jgi:hypothetical protein
MRYRKKDLIELIRKWRNKSVKDLVRWKRYEREYITIAGWLFKKNKIDEEELNAYFWKGIAKTLRKKIEHWLFAEDPQLSLTSAFPKDRVVKIAHKLFERNRFEHNYPDEVVQSSDYSEDSEDSSSEEDSDTEVEGKNYKKKTRKHQKNKKKRKASINFEDSSDSDTDSSDEEKHSSKVKVRKDKRNHNTKTISSKQQSTPKTPIGRSEDTDINELIRRLGHMNLDDEEYAVTYYRAFKLDPDIAKVIQRPKMWGSQSANFNQQMNRSGVRPTFNNMQSNNFQNSNMMTCYGCGKTGHRVGECNEVLKRL